MREATDASQNENLEEEVSTETNPMEESVHEIVTDLSKKDKKLSVLEANFFTLESSPLPELKSSLITPEYICLESNDTLSVSIASNSTPNPKTQFMSILEEQIGEILNKQGSVNGFVNYLLKIKNEDVKYFLKIDNKILKFIVGHLPEIDNLKLLKFVNPIFDMG